MLPRSLRCWHRFRALSIAIRVSLLGHTYVYTVRTVTQVGGDSFDSADSNPVNVVAKDVFLPATPEGIGSGCGACDRRGAHIC